MKPPEPVYLPHPWASMPDPTEFLTRCLRFRAAVPVSLDRWRLDRAHCGAEGLEVVYLRQPGGTTARFAERVRQVFNRIPVFNLVSGGNEGVVFVPWDGFTFRDETVPDAGAQLMQAVSWFQSRQVSFSLSEVKDPPVMPGESAGNDAPQPIKDWHEYTFSITDKHMPEWILQGLNMRGVRLSSVAYTLSPQGQFTYQIEGHLYAKNSVFICGVILMAFGVEAFAQPTSAIPPSAEVTSTTSGREPSMASSKASVAPADTVPIFPGSSVTGGQLEVLQGKTLLLEAQVQAARLKNSWRMQTVSLLSTVCLR